MQVFELPGNPPVIIQMRESARAKRLSLRISQLDGRVTLSVPRGTPFARAEDFAHQKALWLRQHLSKQPDHVRVTWGQTIPIAGKLHRLIPTPERQIICDKAGVLAVPGPLERVPAKVKVWLKTLAQDRFTSACDFYADRLGRSYSQLTLRDTRSRWGSCTADGRLMLSWRLILAPSGVFEYVAAHEVAHLAHMNHSAQYWASVNQIYGDPAPERHWLRKNGADLHRYRFDN
jgi:predicted metal-dependent hydrolase